MFSAKQYICPSLFPCFIRHFGQNIPFSIIIITLAFTVIFIHSFIALIIIYYFLFLLVSQFRVGLKFTGVQSLYCLLALINRWKRARQKHGQGNKVMVVKQVKSPSGGTGGGQTKGQKPGKSPKPHWEYKQQRWNAMATEAHKIMWQESGWNGRVYILYHSGD